MDIKNIIYLVFYYLKIIISFNFVNSKIYSCDLSIKNYKICKLENILISVEVIDPKLDIKNSLLINDKSITSIASYAFKNLTIKTLKLYLSNEILNIIPASFNGLTKVKKIEFLSGFIPVKKNLFQELENLESLSLISDKRDFSIDSVTAGVANLKNLFIEDNDSTIIDEKTFQHGFNISHLTLFYTKIESITINAFSSRHNMSSLIINARKLKYIEPMAFNELNQLENLILINTELNTIDKNIFNGLTNKTRTIKIFNDEIDKIETGAFANFSIFELNLNNNYLKIIESGAFEGATIDRLYLSDNQFIKIQDNAFVNSNISEIYIINGKIPIYQNVNYKSMWGLDDSSLVYLVLDDLDNPEELSITMQKQYE